MNGAVLWDPNVDGMNSHWRGAGLRAGCSCLTGGFLGAQGITH
jgi:hypothetical protein